MARAKPPTRDQVEADLLDVAEQIAAAEQNRDALYERRADLFRAGRALDPPITQAALAAAAGVSETAVITALKKAPAA